MKHLTLLAAVVALTACGGGGYKSAPKASRAVPTSAPFASGPISKACMASDRKARSRQLCGCIQGVANLTLSKSDQSLAASFYRDPQKSQDIRQSDNANHERFWVRYKEYGSAAQDICS